MISYFSIVQYVPDVVRGESLNIGVLTYTQPTDYVRCVFVDPSTRSRVFGIPATMITSIRKSLERLKGLDVLEAAKEWHNSIRLTIPRPSTKDSASLLLSVVSHYLHDEQMSFPARVTREKLKADAIRLIKGRVGKNVSLAAAKMISRSVATIEGKKDEHILDIGFVNGKPLFGANTISFDGTDRKTLHRFIDASAWTISDILANSSDVNLSVIVSEASSEHVATAAKATSLFESLGARVVPPAGLSHWADDLSVILGKHLRPN